MSLTYKEYFKFDGGFNDSTLQDSLKENELSVCNNVVINELGALTMRKGTDKINSTSYGKNVTRRFEYLVNDNSNILEVRDKALYRIRPNNTEIKLATLIHDKPYFNQQQSVVYISDGSKIYELGGKDYFSNSGREVDIKVGDIVQIANDYEVDTSIIGKFYKSKTKREKVNLLEETYTNTTNWEEVTDILHNTSTVFREVEEYDASETEKITFEFFGEAVPGHDQFGVDFAIKYAGDNNDNYIEKIQAICTEPTYTSDETNPSATELASCFYNTCMDHKEDEMNELLFNYWDITFDDISTITFKRKEKGSLDNIYSSGAYLTMTVNGYGVGDNLPTGFNVVQTVVTKGKNSDNILDSEVKKCRMIVQHSYSKRYVATGNPDKPTAIYLSEPYQMNYWSELNVLYPTSGEGKAVCMLNMLDSLLIGYRNGWWRFSGYDLQSDAEFKKISIPNGCVSEFSPQVIDIYNFIFLSNDGLYVASAGVLDQYAIVGQNSNTIKNITDDKVKKTIRSIADKSNCVSVYHDGIYYLAYGDTAGQPNNKILLYYTDKRSFVLYDGLQVNDFLSRSTARLEFASKNYSLYFSENKYTDIDISTGADKKIDFHIKTSNLALENNIAEKFVDKIFVQSNTNGTDDAKYMNININIDGRLFENLDVVKNTVMRAPWNNMPENGNYDVDIQDAFIRYVCNRLSLDFSNTDVDNSENKVTLYGFAISYKTLIPYQRFINLKFHN